MGAPISISAYESDLSHVEERVLAVLESDALPTGERFESDMDAADICFSLAIGLVGIFVATNEDASKWLEGVHSAASGEAGQYDAVQGMLGSLLFHKGDSLDWPIGRNGERTYVMFHRLLFGHDILATGKSLRPHNPFALMYQQSGLMGVAQAARHLIADTMSKQGLPVPGGSYLDTERDGGRPWNRIIDWVQELSAEACGNKKMAQDVYSHMFTIRAQDIVAGGLVAALNGAYASARGIDDPVRRAQMGLVSVSVAFFGQAAVGAARQRGVPYVNNAMVPQVVKAYGALLRASGERTLQLGGATREACSSADAQIGRHVRIAEELSGAIWADGSGGDVEASLSALAKYLED